jgi:hypothetical protein
MMKSVDLLALVRLSLVDPEQGGRAVMALNPPMSVRWMVLALAVVGAVLFQFVPLVLTGQADGLVSPFWPTLAQGAMNLAIALLITFVGRAAGGKGTFPDALLLVGWLQSISLIFMAALLVASLVGPALELPVIIGSIVLTIWMMVGFICAVHGFVSKGLVLLASILVLVMFSMVLSVILLMLGFDPMGGTNV